MLTRFKLMHLGGPLPRRATCCLQSDPMLVNLVRRVLLAESRHKRQILLPSDI
jgi:hypothetical protein